MGRPMGMPIGISAGIPITLRRAMTVHWWKQRAPTPAPTLSKHVIQHLFFLKGVGLGAFALNQDRPFRLQWSK